VRDALANPQRDTDRVVLPPMSYMQEQDKINNAGRRRRSTSREQAERDVRPGQAPVGIVCRAACTMA
jgi:indolepyruvate ferredoxin oxidoreductase alpha subunit